MTNSFATLPPTSNKKEKLKTSLERLGMTGILPWSDAGILREFAGISWWFAGIPDLGEFSRAIPASAFFYFSVFARDLSK
jgi:hypothetical protein